MFGSFRVFSSLEFLDFFEVFSSSDVDQNISLWLRPHQSLHGKCWFWGAEWLPGRIFRRFCRMQKNARKEGNDMMISYTVNIMLNVILHVTYQNVIWYIYIYIYHMWYLTFHQSGWYTKSSEISFQSFLPLTHCIRWGKPAFKQYLLGGDKLAYQLWLSYSINPATPKGIWKSIPVSDRKKHLNHIFRILPAKSSCCRFLIYLALKLTFSADFFEEISGVGAHLESNDFNIFFQRCFAIQSWRFIKIYQEILLEDD